jgi:cell division topological specificity factor
MKFLRKIFERENTGNPGSIAKDRLTLILAHERTANIAYIDDLKRDILEVIKKYTTPSNVSFRTDSHKDIDSIEIDIKL